MAKSSPHRVSIISMHKQGRSSAAIARSLGIHRNTVQNTVVRFKETGGISDRPRSGRPPSVVTSSKIDAVRKRIKRDPHRSMRKMAKQLNVSRETMRRIVKLKLGLVPYRMQKAAILSEKNKKVRLERVRGLLARTRSGEHKRTLFSDEKLFTVEAVYNPQNNRVLAKSPEDARNKGKVVNKASHPLQIMVWAGVCSDGKTPLVFVDPGVKIDQKYYKEEILEKTLLPWSHSHYPNTHWTFQQDGAPAHKAKTVQAWCKNNLPGFIAAHEWPPSSPDLNPLDYSVWSVLEAKVSAKPHHNLESLKASLVKEWDNIDLQYLRSVINAFPKRLKAVLKARGGRIEI